MKYEIKKNEVIVTPDHFTDKTALFGRIVTLLMDSEIYLPDTLRDIKKYLAAPLFTNKCLLYFRDTTLVGYCSWAFLTEEAENRYIAHSNSLEITDWGFGDRLWLIDVAAPYGGKDAITLLNTARKHAVTHLGAKGKRLKFKRYYDVTNYKVQEVEVC